MKTNKQIKQQLHKLIIQLIEKAIQSNTSIKQLRAIYNILQDIECESYKKMLSVRAIIHNRIREQEKL